MRDGRSGETKCVRETNLITPAMGQNSRRPPTPPPRQRTNSHLPILPVYCVQVEAGGSPLRPSPRQPWKSIGHAALRLVHGAEEYAQTGGGDPPEPPSSSPV